jgi:hypothetical protein
MGMVTIDKPGLKGGSQLAVNLLCRKLRPTPARLPEINEVLPHRLWSVHVQAASWPA